MDKKPISLTYAIAKSNPFQQGVPTKLSDLKPQIFVVGFLASKQTQKKKKKKKIQKQKLLESKPLNLQTKTLSTLKKCLNNL